MKYLTASQYADLPMPPVAFLIHRFIPRTGTVMLCGPPKEGKSFLALQIAMAIAEGIPFLGRPSVKSKVLYLQLDNPTDVWVQRLQDLRSSDVILPDNLIIPDPFEPDYRDKIDIVKNPDDLQYLIMMKNDIDPAFIVLDTLFDINGGRENDATDVRQLYDAIMELCRDRCVMLIHHTHKLSPPPGQKIQHRISPVDAARGSSALAGKMNAVYLLNGNILRTDPRFDAKTDYKTHMDPITKLWVFPEEDKIKKQEDQIRSIFKSRSWKSWIEFRKYLNHTNVLDPFPDHLLQRMEQELMHPCIQSEPVVDMTI